MEHQVSYKYEVFLKEFDKHTFAKFRASYESINPDRPIETASIKYGDTEPRFRRFLERGDNLKQAFVDDVLSHLGLFLQGPFPLPGNRVNAERLGLQGKNGGL